MTASAQRQPPPLLVLPASLKAGAVHPDSRYQPCRTLCKTLFGEVTLCLDRQTRKHVAIKMSRMDQVGQQRTTSGELLLEDPQAEARVMAKVSSSNGGRGHRNVLRLLDHQIQTGKGSKGDSSLSWSVLELASRGEMFDLICSGGGLSNARAARYFGQMASGVAYLHRIGVVHLDLSLENMLLDDEDQVKICDFGMAREVVVSGKGGEQKTTMEVELELLRGRPGKVGYMAAEVFEGKPFDGYRADCFSMGVVLFMMLTGLPPWRVPSSSDERYRMITGGQMRRLLVSWGCNHVTAAAEDLLCQLLCAAPAQRWTMEQVLKHPWLVNSNSSNNPVSSPSSAAAAPVEPEKKKSTSDGTEPSSSPSPSPQPMDTSSSSGSNCGDSSDLEMDEDVQMSDCA